MSASYLLDKDPGENHVLTKLDLQRDSEDVTDVDVICSPEDQTPYRSNIINNAHFEYAFADVPPAAQFVPVNTPSLLHSPTPLTLRLPCASAKDRKAHTSTDLSELRHIILAASESIEKRISKKRVAPTHPTAAVRRRKRSVEKTKENTLIKVAEDPVSQRAQLKGSSEVGETRYAPSQALRSATVLGQLSEVTLKKLHSFKFTPTVSCSTGPARSLDCRPDHNAVASEVLTEPQPDIPTADGEESYNEFDLDENIFDIYDIDDAEYRTPESSMPAINGSSIDPRPGNRNPPQATLPKVSACPHPSPQHFKTPPKPIQAPLASMSPFLRSSLPQLASSQSVLPSLIPHRRIPTLFRIAEVYRLLASIPPRAPPQRIELYASVISSRRDFHKKTQEFTFADLFFPQRPPYLSGSSIAWVLCELFDEDSEPFMNTASGGRLCRAIVQVSKNSWKTNARQVGSSSVTMQGGSQGSGKEADALDVEVLNIWEATWDDVKYVRGVVRA
jgi:hypothetical protein